MTDKERYQLSERLYFQFKEQQMIIKVKALRQLSIIWNGKATLNKMRAFQNLKELKERKVPKLRINKNSENNNEDREIQRKTRREYIKS